MTDLLFDLGNSRLKWAICRDGQLSTQHARTWTHLAASAETFGQCLPRRVPDRVFGVSVAGAEREAWLAQLLLARGFPCPHWLRSESAAGGVRNGYLEPARLGADRWMAILGAWHVAGRRGPLAIIDAGTATTLDWVDARGRHRGGLILPGQRLMVTSLLQGTADISQGVRGHRDSGHAGKPGWLARRTLDAVATGAALATTAALGEWLRTARLEGGRHTRVFVTGGAGPALMRSPALAGCQQLPDLVLRGVAFRADC
jgi:type III pantothenate kinase